MWSNMSSPETQIHSQCSFTFILFIHSWNNKHSGLWQGRVLTEGGMQAEGGYHYETQLACSLSPSLSHKWVHKWGSEWLSFVTFLTSDELIPAVLHQLQDPFVLSVDALPCWIPWSVQVRQVSTCTAKDKQNQVRSYLREHQMDGKTLFQEIKCLCDVIIA